MQVRLLRWPPGEKPADGNAAREFALRRRQLTIGRDSFQDVQLLDPSVAPAHAVIRPRAGRLRIEACASQRIRVNGRSCTIASLAEGDIVQIGSATITVRRARKGHSVLLEIEEATPTNRPMLPALHTLSLRETRLNAHLWSWALVLSVIALFLIPALSAALFPPSRPVLRASTWVPSDRLWQSGPLHPSHQAIGGQCNVCHAVPFRRVRNAQCTACHKSVQHHVDVRTRDVALFQERRCGACHLDHEEPSILVQRDPRLCTDCHRHLTELKSGSDLMNVTDFGADHPDFRLTMLEPSTASSSSEWHEARTPRGAAAPITEHSGLTFSHAVHMARKGIKSPQGYDVMKCQDCHQPNTGGRQMLPIRMEAHCSRCHSLRFDEHDPASAVPHGNLERVFETLQGHFVRSYLDAPRPPDQRTSAQPRRPGSEAEVMTRDEQRRARNWANQQSLLVAAELLEKRVCVQCHRVTRVPGGSGFAQWRVAPVRITQDWMPRAEFNHASHITTECATCHARAAESKSSSNVLMPAIGVCRQCHGGTRDTTKLASDCGMCHRFHLPGRGLFDAAARPTQQSPQ